MRTIIDPVAIERCLDCGMVGRCLPLYLPMSRLAWVCSDSPSCVYRFDIQRRWRYGYDRGFYFWQSVA